MKYDIVVFEALADLCINLSAGWFGAAFIIPTFSKGPRRLSFTILIVDVVFGIVFIAIAILLRRQLL